MIYKSFDCNYQPWRFTHKNSFYRRPVNCIILDCIGPYGLIMSILLAISYNETDRSLLLESIIYLLRLDGRLRVSGKNSTYILLKRNNCCFLAIPVHINDREYTFICLRLRSGGGGDIPADPGIPIFSITRC